MGCYLYNQESFRLLYIWYTIGFMTGRHIGENNRFIYDLLSYIELKNIPGLLVLIYFEKALDSMRWSFINQVLKYFGFGKNVIQWIKIFNANFHVAILQCGQFVVKRCMQGNSVAQYSFIMCAKILAIMIKENKDIKGIFINEYHNMLMTLRLSLMVKPTPYSQL